MDSYTTLRNEGCSRFEDRKSVFLGYARPVSSEDEALAFIEAIRKKYPDARHHVYAYSLRDNSITRFSDDREPQGTAGLPVLDSLRHSEIKDAVVVVVRYFGGTLLGTGGLVRAYSAAASDAVRAAEVIVYDMYSCLDITVSYSDHGRIATLLEERGFRIEDTVYDECVTLCGKILCRDEELFVKALVDITCGRCKIKKKEEKFDF